MEITQVRFRQKDRYLASEQSKSEFLSVKLRNGTAETKARFPLPKQFLLERVIGQETIQAPEKFVGHRLARDQAS